MFRRIELIFEQGEIIWDDKPLKHSWKQGICGVTREEVADAWFDRLAGPNRTLPNNSRFYFTEQGWKEVGRPIVNACQACGQKYRVIKIKERSVDVEWKHELEVAAQPKRSGSRDGRLRRASQKIWM